MAFDQCSHTSGRVLSVGFDHCSQGVVGQLGCHVPRAPDAEPEIKDKKPDIPSTNGA